MGAHPFTQLDPVTSAGLCLGSDVAIERDPVAAPFLEGARARAIADLCDRLLLPALLLERTGQVLLESRHAKPYLQGAVRLEQGRLRAAIRSAERPLMLALRRALDESPTTPCPIRVRVDASLILLAYRYRNESPYQLVKGVIVLTGDEAAISEGLLGLSELLSVA
jgi:hypothetical protein